MKYDNYLFDLYGTLIDIRTNENRLAFWKKIAMYFSMQGAFFEPAQLRKQYVELELRQREELAEKTSKRMKTFITCKEIENRNENIFKALLKEKGVSFDTRQMKNFMSFFRMLSIEHIKLFDGVIKVLEELHNNGKKIYLLSNAQRLFTEQEVRYFSLEKYFDDIFYSSDYGFKKPSQFFYQVPFDKYDLSKDKTVMVGNEIMSDIYGAHNFGIDSMFINTLNMQEYTLPDNCVELYDITEVLKY